jgi:hypothetical protein
MSILRSVAAVVGGYVIFAISAFALFQVSGRDPHAPQPVWFMVASTVYGMLFAALGGFVAARISPTRALLHATIVAGVLALGAIVSLVTSTGATWSQWSALILMAPSAYAGGRLAVRR